MFMVFMILNWITEKKPENRLSKAKNSEAQEQVALESCEPSINGDLLEEVRKAMVRICLNRAEPALTHEDGLVNVVKPHSSMTL